MDLDAGRWRLRDWRLGDIGAVLEAGHDELIPLITTVPPAPATTADAEAFVRRQWSRWDDGGWAWAICDADDAAVGSLTVLPSQHGRFSAGYWVAGSARGQGAAAAALSAAAPHVLADDRVERLELYVEPWNVASITTAERVGFVREGLLRSWETVGESRRDMWMYARLPDA